MKKFLSVCISGAIAITFIASADVSAQSLQLEMLDDNKNKNSSVKKNNDKKEESIKNVVSKYNLPSTILGDFNVYKCSSIDNDENSIEVIYKNKHNEEIELDKGTVNSIMSAYSQLSETADMNIDEITIQSANEITEIEVSDMKIELLCENGKVNVAKWSDGDYNYSIISKNGIAVEEMSNLVLEIIYGENISIISNMTNPHTQFETLEEAQEDIGFKMDIKMDLFSNVKANSYSVFKNNEEKMLEVVYQNNSGKDVTLRKSNFEDVSGVHKDFSEVSEISVKGIKVLFKGEDDNVEVVEWSKDNYNYSVVLEEPISIYDIGNIIQDALYSEVKNKVASIEKSNEISSEDCLVNPYIEFNTIEEAQQNVGFSLDLSFEILDNLEIKRCVTYNYGADKFIEVVYQNKNNKDITLRQGTIKDISGVYKEYSENLEFNVNGIKVHLKCEDDNVEVVEWATEDYNYSVVLEEPISIYEIGNIIQKILYSNNTINNIVKQEKQSNLKHSVIGFVNPYIEYDTIEQAEEKVGFELGLPVGLLDDYIVKKYSTYNDDEDKVLEVIFENSNDNNMTIRKGTIENISGVHTEYPEVLVLSVNGKNVKFNGKNDNVEVIEWSDRDYNYSIVLEEEKSSYDCYTLIQNLIG